MCKLPEKPEEGAGSPVAEITGMFKLPVVDLETRPGCLPEQPCRFTFSVECCSPLCHPLPSKEALHVNKAEDKRQKLNRKMITCKNKTSQKIRTADHQYTHEDTGRASSSQGETS